MTPGATEALLALDEVARRQADIIDRLFLLLAQHVQAEELAEEAQAMREAARLHARLTADGDEKTGGEGW